MEIEIKKSATIIGLHCTARCIAHFIISGQLFDLISTVELNSIQKIEKV